MSINENEIIKQLSEIIDRVSLDKLGIKQKLEAELDRYSQFRYAVLELGEEELKKKKNFDMKKYAKFILEKGSLYEKKNLVDCLRNKVSIQDKKIILNTVN